MSKWEVDPGLTQAVSKYLGNHYPDNPAGAAQFSARAYEWAFNQGVTVVSRVDGGMVGIFPGCREPNEGEVVEYFPGHAHTAHDDGRWGRRRSWAQQAGHNVDDGFGEGLISLKRPGRSGGVETERGPDLWIGVDRALATRAFHEPEGLAGQLLQLVDREELGFLMTPEIVGEVWERLRGKCQGLIEIAQSGRLSAEAGISLVDEGMQRAQRIMEIYEKGVDVSELVRPMVGVPDGDALYLEAIAAAGARGNNVVMVTGSRYLGRRVRDLPVVFVGEFMKRPDMQELVAKLGF